MIEAQQTIDKQVSPQPISFQWDENSDVKDLLDVVASILTKEYVQTVKENPDVF